MTTSPYRDAIEHHLWATDLIFEACVALTPEQLDTAVPGAYGSIIDTLRHVIQGDSFYLQILTGGRIQEIPPEAKPSLAELRAAMATHASLYRELVARETDPELDVPERGDGWEFHAPFGLRIAQVLDHGSDHRSQIRTALTNLGITPPEMDLWHFGSATGRTWAVEDSAPSPSGT